MFTPTTVVRLLENIDITVKYKNTFSFTSESAQSSFFISKTKTGGVFTNFVYQRKQKTLKVPVNVESLWNVSYMMFQNSDFGIKWFYAFITDMKFVNDETTEISFEIDVMQTWYFNVDIKDCYIEREHVDSDDIGEHTVLENLNIGDLIIQDIDNFLIGADIAIVVVVTELLTGTLPKGMYNGVYSAFAYYLFDTADYLLVNDLIDDYATAGKTDAIVSIYMCPKSVMPTFTSGDLMPRNTRTSTDFTSPKPTDLNGYTPKNNKLFVSPYSTMVLNNSDGQENEYKYEYFSDVTNVEFLIRGVFVGNPEQTAIPINYKNTDFYAPYYTDFEEILVLKNYPQCSWDKDIYKNWLAQNSITNTLSIGSSLLSLGVGVATGNPIAIGGGVIGVASSIGQFVEKSVIPISANGNVSSNTMLCYNDKTFMIFHKCLREENAIIIDNFFDKFGYKVNRLKIPNLTSRLNWNFIKTHESNIFGNIPNNDLKQINNIYDNGVTFWHNNNVGNYNRDNTIV